MFLCVYGWLWVCVFMCLYLFQFLYNYIKFSYSVSFSSYSSIFFIIVLKIDDIFDRQKLMKLSCLRVELKTLQTPLHISPYLKFGGLPPRSRRSCWCRRDLYSVE